MSELTPMIKQYLAIKEKYRDAILLYRLGDFYEMFFEDATTASKILGLTLTSRNKNQADSVPLCGIPFHAAQTYIHTLLENGHKVAICEQVEDPKEAKGIVKREVVSVLTPGLVMDPECLEDKASNNLVSIFKGETSFGIAIVDVSTGHFLVTEMPDAEKMKEEVLRLSPKEILLEEKEAKAPWVLGLLAHFSHIRHNFLPGWFFDEAETRHHFKKLFNVDPGGFGLDSKNAALVASGSILSYLSENKVLKENLLSHPRFYTTAQNMIVDDLVIRNLELFKTLGEQKTTGSLFWLLDRAQTPMGSRKIREWITYPLLDIQKINQRQSAIESLIAQPFVFSDLVGHLKEMSDLERLQNRVIAETANPRDLLGLGLSLLKLNAVKENLEKIDSPFLKNIGEEIVLLPELAKKIEETLVTEPGLAIKEGGLIKPGVSPILDELRTIEQDGKAVISAMEAKERELTGISSLKIRFNRVFGYYIEITHTHKDKIPSHYIRKQTLTGAERFITPELKSFEEKVLGAEEKSKRLEYEIFTELRKEIASHSEAIKKNASLIASVDALSSLSIVAKENNYVRPVLKEDPVLKIKKGRHPLVEVLFRDEAYVPNDILLSPDSCLLSLITGPNMAGKSTVMRLSALIVLMAQMGSFVPAESAEVGLCDRIFTRIGASDYLQKGQSTFMVEMLETAQILSQATEKSLIILDEIGRGTSTFDGLSIAWAVAETIHDKIKARTLFATHYHELTDLASEKPRIKNFHMAVHEWKGDIRFLRELREGGSNRSYGVAVASMAGLPQQTITRAKEILKILEEKDWEFQTKTQKPPAQLSLFDDKESVIVQKLKDVDTNHLTPIQALQVLEELKKLT